MARRAGIGQRRVVGPIALRIPGVRFVAAVVPCSVGTDAKGSSQCSFGVIRTGRGQAEVGQPWLARMVALFAFEFIEGNTITRLYFLRLRRLTTVALEQGAVTRDLESRLREDPFM